MEHVTTRGGPKHYLAKESQEKGHLSLVQFSAVHVHFTTDHVWKIANAFLGSPERLYKNQCNTRIQVTDML